ncbi:MAG: DNA-directed RNA polymerase subunit alpha [Sedimentisphaerales bacterium]|nr:DNA-directed RNA polymerase subunit alpha [Sedimentisphaerales bacterium]
MRIRWRGLELPNQVVLDKEVSTETYGRLVIEPFERGFGITVGNSLRRILLSSLEGSAVTSLKIAGAPHEFTSLEGVKEDVTGIILNVKSLVIRLDRDEPTVMRVSASQAGTVTAAQIETGPELAVINKDQVLATLTQDIHFSMEMTVKRGRGYVPASMEDDAASQQELGVIPIDAIFSPVRRVRYKTEETRVGQRINYDRLIMEIWTDGTIGPELALVEAAKILRKHLGPFIQYFELGPERAESESAVQAEAVESGLDEELKKKLGEPVSSLDLSVRATNCLEMAKLETIRDLVRLTDSELLALRSFGKTSLREVKRKLADLGLELGMQVD